MRKSREDSTKFAIEDAFRTQYRRLRNLKTSGIVDAYDGLPMGELESKLSRAREVVLLNTWMPNAARLLRSLQKADRNGASIRILFADPRSDVASLRNHDLGLIPGSVSQQIASVWSLFGKDGGLSFVKPPQIGQQTVSNPPNVSAVSDDKSYLKFYEGMPSIPVYGIDDEYYFGVFWYQRQGVQGSFVRVQDGHLKENIKQHVEDLCKSARDPSHTAIPELVGPENRSHLYYQSESSDGVFWRYAYHSTVISHRRIKDPETDTDLSLELRTRLRNRLFQIEVFLLEINDLGIITFPMPSGSAFSPKLAGTFVHADWLGRPRSSRALLSRSPLHKGDVPDGDVLSTDTAQDLNDLWDSLITH